ncbi:excinuclease ABC subunit A [Acidimangrovimonas pyrenivorans]|uniref:Excinuclease ABC subunit A n=1 Tax=Acidimangrovimonas pyrenivorans TaxID=2030798 RepID=A0ABV7ACU0_9RHOB
MRQITSRALLAAALLGLGGLALGAAPVAAGGCPPGLQKKHNGCRPPGLAKKPRHREERHRWREGDRIGRSDYVILRDYRRYGLPPLPDGAVYVSLGGQLLRVDADTLKVLGVVGLVRDLLN